MDPLNDTGREQYIHNVLGTEKVGYQGQKNHLEKLSVGLETLCPSTFLKHVKLLT